MTNIAVFISGRGSNFIKLQENIWKGEISNANIAVVFSNKNDAKGLEFAKEHNIPTIVLDEKDYSNRKEFDKAIIDVIKPYNVDLICLAGYMRIVTEELVNEYKNRILNIHPALLPAFPGLNSQKQALDYGVKVAGCTVHFVDTGVDTGPIVLQKVVDVKSDDTLDILTSKILEQEHVAYSEAVNLFCTNRLTIKDRTVKISETGIN